MPCGGIYPIKDSDIEPFLDAKQTTCFSCGQPTDTKDLFCAEWDCTLHYNCLVQFLASEEGKIVIRHGHSIIAFHRDEIAAGDNNDKNESINSSQGR